MKNFVVLAEVFKTRNLAEDIITVRGEIEIHLPNDTPSAYAEVDAMKAAVAATAANFILYFL